MSKFLRQTVYLNSLHPLPHVRAVLRFSGIPTYAANRPSLSKRVDLDPHTRETEPQTRHLKKNTAAKSLHNPTKAFTKKLRIHTTILLKQLYKKLI